MKDSKKSDLLFSLCGLNCGLCPVHAGGYCSGCGGEDSQSCKTAGIAHCDRKRDLKKTAILIVSIATGAKSPDSVNGENEDHSYNKSIDALERAIENEFPDCEVGRIFTGRKFPDRLAADGVFAGRKISDRPTAGEEPDTVKSETDKTEAVLEKALEKAISDGTANLVIQPTCLMKGYKYTDLAKILDNYKEKFNRIILGRPLLWADADFAAAAKAITERTAEYDDGATAICYVGHGTEAASNDGYANSQD